MAIKVEEVLSVISDEKFHPIIRENFNTLLSGYKFPVKIVLCETDFSVKQEGIYKGGKVEWILPRGQFHKTPQCFKIDIKNLKDLEFVCIFLHECGHFKDYRNFHIPFQSEISELSAWNHALASLYGVINSDEEWAAVFQIAKVSLASYEVNLKTLDELRDKESPLFNKYNMIKDYNHLVEERINKDLIDFIEVNNHKIQLISGTPMNYSYWRIIYDRIGDKFTVYEGNDDPDNLASFTHELFHAKEQLNSAFNPAIDAYNKKQENERYDDVFSPEMYSHIINQIQHCRFVEDFLSRDFTIQMFVEDYNTSPEVREYKNPLTLYGLLSIFHSYFFNYNDKIKLEYESLMLTLFGYKYNDLIDELTVIGNGWKNEIIKSEGEYFDQLFSATKDLI